MKSAESKKCSNNNENCKYTLLGNELKGIMPTWLFNQRIVIKIYREAAV